MEIQFRVQGSSTEPYLVTFIRDVEGLIASCTCAAGSMGQYCKHRLAILAGDATSLVSDNGTDIATVTQWLDGSMLSRALAELEAAEQQLEAAKRAVASAKKRLSQAFSGR
jgi:hypothetical protein